MSLRCLATLKTRPFNKITNYLQGIFTRIEIVFITLQSDNWTYRNLQVKLARQNTDKLVGDSVQKKDKRTIKFTSKISKNVSSKLYLILKLLTSVNNSVDADETTHHEPPDIYIFLIIYFCFFLLDGHTAPRTMAMDTFR